jgi:serine protease Do
MGNMKHFLVKPNDKSYPVVLMSMLAALVICGGCGFLLPATVTVTNQTPTATVTLPAATGTVTLTISDDASDLSSFVAVVDKVKPSVVRVETNVAAGTGWIIDSNGILVTNNHVVEDGSDITVYLNDGRSFEAQSVETDTFSDLAIIRVNATGLPAATIGSSSKLRVGEPVAAIGNGLNEGISLKGGWVSRLHATAEVTGQVYYDLIETDAAINEGNSGGPLVNMAGEVVGITSAKMVELGVEGIGYAIGMDSAVPILEQLMNSGAAQHPFLGIGPPMEVTPFGISVGEVMAGDPAAQAGLQAGDIVVAIDDVRVTTVSELYSFIQTKRVGQRIKVTYRRGDNQSDLFVTLKARAE